MDQPAVATPPEHRRFAAVLEIGVAVALLVMSAAYLLYITATVDAQVPLAAVQAAWGEPHDRYVAQTSAPVGWEWLRHPGRADNLNLLGLAILGLLSPLAMLAVLPCYLRRRELGFAVVLLLSTTVILLSASGLVSAGH